MKPFKTFFLTIALGGMVFSAQADNLSFEDAKYDTQNNVGTTEAGRIDQYNGFMFKGAWTLNASLYQEASGYQLAATSGNRVLYNWSYDSAAKRNSFSVTSANNGLFDFTSANMIAAWRDGLIVEVVGFKGGQELYKTTLTLNAFGSPETKSFDFYGIDKLTISSWGGVAHAGYHPLHAGGLQVVIDDMNLTHVAAVPEPSTYAMMFAGLGALGLMVRRRKIQA